MIAWITPSLKISIVRSEQRSDFTPILDCVDSRLLDFNYPSFNHQENRLKEKQPQLCYGCHLETKQQFNRPFH